MIKRLVIIAIVSSSITLICGEYVALAQNVKTERIAISKLKKQLDSGQEFLLIDVREDWELKEHGAIPGAIHIPMAELEKRMEDIPKDIPLVFY
ncbi:MAG: rhodanese-like domain-containing protein [Acidobacteriota bacterium]|nr:rhodanese-like domain-containing protein [Acidobacteriota bacterium]